MGESSVHFDESWIPPWPSWVLPFWAGLPYGLYVLLISIHWNKSQSFPIPCFHLGPFKKFKKSCPPRETFILPITKNKGPFWELCCLVTPLWNHLTHNCVTVCLCKFCFHKVVTKFQVEIEKNKLVAAFPTWLFIVVAWHCQSLLLL
jgi:hypothetical protein